MTTYRFEPLAPRATVRIADAAGDTVEDGTTDDTGVYSTELDAGSYLATTNPDRVVDHTTAHGVAIAEDGDVLTYEAGIGYVPAASDGLGLAASTYGVAAAYVDATPTAGTQHKPAWDYLDELGDFLILDPEDEDDNRLVITLPGVYQISVSAETKPTVTAPGEFWLRMSLSGTNDPGYAPPVAGVTYDDARAWGSISRVLVVPPGTTASFSAFLVAVTNCEIGVVEVQVTKIA